nr:hypothetical protein [Cytophagales bacterium]
MEATTEKNERTTKQINRIAYTAFVFLGIYYFIQDDWATGVSQFGIALVFDPFDQKVSWNNRPLYQRIWMITHLILLLVSFIWMFYKE